MAQHVADVIGFIEKLDAGPVDLMGHSRGGHISFRVAQRRPELLRKLVLAEPGGELDATLDPAAEPGPSPARGEVRRRGREDRGRRYRRRADAVLRCDRRRRRVGAAAGGAEAATARQCLYADRPGPATIGRRSRKADAEVNRTPTLFIGGADTKGALPRGAAHAGGRARPTRKTAMIPGTSHWMFEQAPQEVARSCWSFWRGDAERLRGDW